MRPERDAFLKALAADEDDDTTRLVYADWLDDHGEHEEADRMRRWRAAKDWLVAFADRCGHYEADFGTVDPETHTYRHGSMAKVTYQLVMDHATRYATGEHWDDFSYWPAEQMADGAETLFDDPKERVVFWTMWGVVTGRPTPAPLFDTSRGNPFRCGCG